MCRRRLLKRVSLSIGTPLGNLGPFTGNFERWLKEGSRNGTSLSVVALLQEPGGGGGSFAGNPEGYVEESLGNEHLSPWGACWAAWMGAHLPGTYALKKALEIGLSP